MTFFFCVVRKKSACLFAQHYHIYLFRQGKILHPQFSDNNGMVGCSEIETATSSHSFQISLFNSMCVYMYMTTLFWFHCVSNLLWYDHLWYSFVYTSERKKKMRIKWAHIFLAYIHPHKYNRTKNSIVRTLWLFFIYHITT